MDESLYHEFFRVEEEHWWFVGRQDIVLDQMLRLSAEERGKRLLDIGCGTAAFLKTASGTYEAWGTDVSPLAIEYARQRGLSNLQCGTLDTISFDHPQFDRITLLDVIEHVDDDAKLLRQAADLLAPGGRIIITVPAHPWLWSEHDVLNHHRRRYSRSHLKAAIASAGLRMTCLTAINTFLFPAAIAQRLLGRITGRTGDPLNIPPRPLNALFTSIFRSERRLIRSFPLPVGLSFLAVAGRD